MMKKGNSVMGILATTTPSPGNEGSPGRVYDATLLDGRAAAIKKLDASTQPINEFLTQVDTPYERSQMELLGEEVVAGSKGCVGENLQPVVICGPSGVGKGTLIKKLMNEFPDKFGFSVSHTTRKPRNLEQNGVHYHFTERAVMEKAIMEGKFLESADVHGNMYGTSIAAVEYVADSGKKCILDIDVQGAQSVKKSSLNALFVFISPPSFEELEARLQGRGTETQEQIQKRLKNAKGEMARGSDHTLFDHMVTNDNIDTAYMELKELLGLSKRPSSNGFH